jgi:formate dehydrogenase
MPHHGMTPHMSGTSLSAQARYAAGTREILECWLEGRPIREEYIIVDSGKLAGTGALAYTVPIVECNADELQLKRSPRVNHHLPLLTGGKVVFALPCDQLV